MSKTEFRKFVDQAQALPPEVVLGNIVWFEVGEDSYRADEIEKLFDSLGLNPSLLPPPIKAINAFEKATSAATGTKYDLPNGNTAELLVREVTSDSETVVRHLIREIKDGKKKRLAYDKIGEIVFYRPVVHNKKIQVGSERLRATISPEMLYPNEKPLIENVIKAIDADYLRYRDFLDGNKVRGVVRNYLGYLNAVMMKSGVYFVHSTRTEELERLRTFVRNFPTCSMSMFPLPDLKDLREEVVEAFQREAEKELNEVVAEISKVRSTRAKITVDAHSKLKASYERVMRKATEYSRTLKVTQERTAGAAEIALDSLLALEADMRKQMES